MNCIKCNKEIHESTRDIVIFNGGKFDESSGVNHSDTYNDDDQGKVGGSPTDQISKPLENIFRSTSSKTINEDYVVLYTDLTTWDHKNEDEKNTVGNCVVVSRDGTMIAWGYKKKIKVWRNTKGVPRLVHDFEGHADSIKGICFSPDNKILASISTYHKDKTIKLWNLTADEKPENLRTIDLPEIGNYNKHIEFSHDGKNLIYVKNSDVFLYNIEKTENDTPEKKIGEQNHEDTDTNNATILVYCIAHGWDGTLFATSGISWTGNHDTSKGFINLFDTSNNYEKTSFFIQGSTVTVIAISHNNNYIAFGRATGEIGLLTIKQDGKEMMEIFHSKPCESSIDSLAFSYDSKILAVAVAPEKKTSNELPVDVTVASEKKPPTIKIYDIESLEKTKNSKGQEVSDQTEAIKAQLLSPFSVNSPLVEYIHYKSIAFLPDNTIVSGGNPNSVRIWTCVPHNLVLKMIYIMRLLQGRLSFKEEEIRDRIKRFFLPVDIQRSIINFWPSLSESCEWQQDANDDDKN